MQPNQSRYQDAIRCASSASRLHNLFQGGHRSGSNFDNSNTITYIPYSVAKALTVVVEHSGPKPVVTAQMFHLKVSGGTKFSGQFNNTERVGTPARVLSWIERS